MFYFVFIDSSGLDIVWCIIFCVSTSLLGNSDVESTLQGSHLVFVGSLHLDVDEAVGSLFVEADGEDSLLIEFHLAFLWLDAALQGEDWLLVVTGEILLQVDSQLIAC